MSIDADQFKQALRAWPSGVTIVTAKSDDDMHGMTVSAFSSVSAEPPLVLVCCNRNSRTHSVVKAAGSFNVHILSADQAELSNHFASSKTDASRFDGIAHRMGENGAPILDGTLAAMECTVRAAYEEGSHTLYIGAVDHLHLEEGKPLVYHDGGYRELHG